MTIEIQGLNLEKLLREAQSAGIALKGVRRASQRCVVTEVSPWERRALYALCERFGWETKELRAGVLVRAGRFARRRPMLFAGALLCALLVALSSHVVLKVEITGAQEYEAEVRRCLEEEGASVGQLKRMISFDGLREQMLLRLPGISYAGFRYAGSVLEVDCRLAREGELVDKPGSGLDLVASEAGVVTKLVAGSGTPLVRVGDAVYAGQVLVRGEERSERGETVPVRAQAQVFARVWAQGSARASLHTQTAKETGKTRTRVAIVSPWHSHIVRDAQPFAKQEVSVREEAVIDLFIPLIRRTEVFSEIVVSNRARSRADAASMAQGAAEKLAKKQLPEGALILDKWVDYSMIDNEFLYASVVIEYEKDVAVREGGL